MKDPWKNSPWWQQEDLNKRQGHWRVEAKVRITFRQIANFFKWIFGKKNEA